MKLYFLMTLLICGSVVGFAQTKKADLRPSMKPIQKPAISTASPDVSPTQPEIPKQKVLVEKLNGDRLSGLFVGANADSITIELSSVQVPIRLEEIKTVWFSDFPALDNIPTAKTVAERDINLALEAAIIYRSGEVVPIARTTFLLLDDSVVNILRKAGVKPTNTTARFGKSYDDSIYTDLGFSARYGNLPEYAKFLSEFASAVKPHIKFGFDTDFAGKASVPNIPDGKYFLFSIANTRNSGVVWNLEIDTSTSRSFVLDTKNAAFAY